jgi:hypothetical protein
MLIDGTCKIFLIGARGRLLHLSCSEEANVTFGPAS